MTPQGSMTGNALDAAGEGKPSLPWFLTSESMRVLVPGGISCFLSRRFFQVCWEEDAVAIPAAFLRLLANDRVRSAPTKGGYPCAVIPLTVEEAEALRTGPFMLATQDLRPREFQAERWGRA